MCTLTLDRQLGFYAVSAFHYILFLTPLPEQSSPFLPTGQGVTPREMTDTQL